MQSMLETSNWNLPQQTKKRSVPWTRFFYGRTFNGRTSLMEKHSPHTRTMCADLLEPPGSSFRRRRSSHFTTRQSDWRLNISAWIRIINTIRGRSPFNKRLKQIRTESVSNRWIRHDRSHPLGSFIPAAVITTEVSWPSPLELPRRSILNQRSLRWLHSTTTSVSFLRC